MWATERGLLTDKHQTEAGRLMRPASVCTPRNIADMLGRNQAAVWGPAAPERTLFVSLGAAEPFQTSRFAAPKGVALEVCLSPPVLDYLNTMVI